MHIGRHYTTKEVLFWTSHNIYKLFFLGLIPVIFFELLNWQWVALPWAVAALLGTATSFIVGFRNSQTYNRTWEARQIWGGIVNASRTWAVTTRDFIDDKSTTTLLVNRHFAWLTALRYAMREPKANETMPEKNNITFQQKIFSIPERETTLEEELKKYLDEKEAKDILTSQNKAAQLLNLQSKTLKLLKDSNRIDHFLFIEMENQIKDLFELQGQSERIKNFPYPRQFATSSQMLVKLFIVLLPFCMINEFDGLNENSVGIMKGYMVWLVIPFSMIISWVFTTLDQVGESSENPFDGNANDVPISQISRKIEIDIREMLGETHLPSPLQPRNNIIL